MFEKKWNYIPFRSLTHKLEISLPEIVFITTFPPRECGIATYSEDLITALENQFSKSFKINVCALETNHEKPEYLQKPMYRLNTDKKEDFLSMAYKLNTNSNINSIVIQHEFGLFAKNKETFERFYLNLNKPILFVFHTVLPNPNNTLKAEVQKMGEKAAAIIVMTKNAAQILNSYYDIPFSKINIIPHGIHLSKIKDKCRLKEKYHFVGKKILSTFGLLSPNKGIETTLNALPKIIKKFPNVLFLILGKTHPCILKMDGEQYRLQLEAKVKELNLTQHVLFVNEYLSLPILLEYLQLTDIYLFTSTDSNQAVSGTFSYALGAGCPIISTPIPHAKELLNRNTGRFFEFGNSNQLATATLALLKNPERTNQLSLNALHKMAPCAWENSAILHSKLIQKLSPQSKKLTYQMPPIKLDHIQNMTTDFGMIQFAKISCPDLNTGYTIDDNARALISICQVYEKNKDPKYLRLINIYLQYIKHCMQPNGKFINYLDIEKNISPQNSNENLDDSNGRAIWALGYVCSLKEILPEPITSEAERLLSKVIPNVEQIYSTRTMAFIIKGLYFQNKKENQYLIKIFADRMVQMYLHESKKDWYWFEDCLTYGNSVLPESLLYAYLRIKDKNYKIIAEASFDFLLSKIFKQGQIRVISNKGWLYKNKKTKNVKGGEQPIDVAYTVIALKLFHKIFPSKKYKEKSKIAFNWFLGENQLNQTMYNPSTGGCYDGLEEKSVNLNQGAESTISYLLARLSVI
jgi:glycosyltransferase involved in cell wall biosynthesis